MRMRVLAVNLIAVLALCSGAFGIAPIASGLPTPIVASTPAAVDYDFDGSNVDIPFDVTGDGLGSVGATVHIAIYSGIPASTLVKTWEVGTFDGAGTASWDGTDADGQAVPEDFYTVFIYAVNNNEPARLVGIGSNEVWSTTGSLDLGQDPPVWWHTEQYVTSNHGINPYWGRDGASTVDKSRVGQDYLGGVGGAPGAENKGPLDYTSFLSGPLGDAWSDDDARTVFEHVEFDPKNPDRVFVANAGGSALQGIWAFNIVSEDVTIVEEGGPGTRGEWEIDTSWNDDGRALDTEVPRRISIHDGVIYVLTTNKGTWGSKGNRVGVAKLDYRSGEEIAFIDLSDFIFDNPEAWMNGPNGLYVDGRGIWVSDTIGAEGTLNDIGRPGENVEATLIHTDLDGNVIWVEGLPAETTLLIEGNPFIVGMTHFGVWADRYQNVYVTSFAGQNAVNVTGPDGKKLWNLGYDNSLHVHESSEVQSVIVADFPPGDSRSKYNGMYVSSRALLAHFPYSVAKGALKPPGVDIPTAVAEVDEVPAAFALSQNYPNPFNPSTVIEFSLTSADFATVVVYNIAGQVVRSLVSEQLEAGRTYRVEWDGRDDYGVQQASGIYTYELRAGDSREAKKMTLGK